MMDDHPPTMIDIQISETRRIPGVDREALAALARAVLAAEGIERASVSIAIVDDPTIHALNRRHLSHDWPTDVITFPLSEPGEPELAAELVLSADTALDQARESGASPPDELALYLVHGLLHLCGYDDHEAQDVARMRRREAELLRSFAQAAPPDGPGSPLREESPCSR